jgi:DNA-binding MarR family transcriptional regulator
VRRCARYARGVSAPSGPSPAEGAWPSRTELSREEQCVWRALLAVHARLVERLDEALRSTHGLSLADYDVLVALAEGPAGGLRMRELAGRVLLSPSGLTRRVDRLTARGLVARRLCPSDRRGSLAALTAEGATVLAAATPTHVGAVRRYVLDPLGPGGFARLGGALAGMSAALTEGQPLGPRVGRDPDR